MPTSPASGLSCLLNPQSVAVIGASDDPARIGGRPLSYLLAQGFAGPIWPINPNRATVQGLPAFASVDTLPSPLGAPDVAIVAVPGPLAVAAVADLARRGTKVAIVFSSGFAEVGEAGLTLQAQLLAAADCKGHRMRLLGPNTLGVVNPRNGFFGSFISSVDLGMPRPGGVAIISQSGAYGGHLLTQATAAGMGLSALVMTGNEADITLGDGVQMAVDDAHTEVIALYSEGLRNPAGLVQALEAARRARKPVVMMKVGRSAVGRAAAHWHTASDAGDDAAIHTLLADAGVVRADSTEHLLDIARLATRRIYPANNSLGVISISGGAGVVIADAAHDAGLPLPAMPSEAQQALKAILPYASPMNPVDTTGQFLNDVGLVGSFTQAVVEAGGYPSILGFFSYTGSVPALAPRILAQLIAVRDRFPDRLFVLCVLGPREQIQAYEDAGFCVFEDPTRAVRAIAAMGRFGDAFSTTASAVFAATKALALHPPNSQTRP